MALLRMHFQQCLWFWGNWQTDLIMAKSSANDANPGHRTYSKYLKVGEVVSPLL